jgi:hypothetical protein
MKFEDELSSRRNGWKRKMGEDMGTVDGVRLGGRGRISGFRPCCTYISILTTAVWRDRRWYDCTKYDHGQLVLVEESVLKQ